VRQRSQLKEGNQNGNLNLPSNINLRFIISIQGILTDSWETKFLNRETK